MGGLCQTVAVCLDALCSAVPPWAGTTDLRGHAIPMPPTAPIDLDALSAFLMSDRAPQGSMGLSDLDGFLTGVVVGPELIMPSEWTRVVWGGEGPDFESMEEALAIHGTITGRYNEIRRRLDTEPQSFDPVF